MKYFVFIIGILTSLHAVSQDKRTQYFELIWPDNSATVIHVAYYYNSEGYELFYSLLADNSIQFNAKINEDSGYKDLNPNNSIQADSVSFFNGPEEMFLNKDYMDEAYFYQPYEEEGFIRFRNSSDTTITGKIKIYAWNGLECVHVNCHQMEHYSTVQFATYSLLEGPDTPINLVTGTKKKQAASVKILPNPSESVFTIMGPAQETYTITGIDGEIVKDNVSANAKTDISDLAPGIYIVKDHLSGFVGKLIKN